MPILARTRILPLQPVGNPLIRQCAFAHDNQELRDKHTLDHHYKTKACINFKNIGVCKYGERCRFLHLSEAPTVYARPNAPLLPFPVSCSSFSQKSSDSRGDYACDRHQKHLNLLTSFGLALL